MKVVVTEQSLDRLEQSLRFFIDEMNMPVQKVTEIKSRLLERARGLSLNPYKGQIESYLKKLKKGHRRVIEGSFKIVFKIENETIYVTDFFDSRRDTKMMIE